MDIWSKYFEKNGENFDAVTEYGLLLLDAGQSKAAEQIFNKAVALGPTAYTSHYNLGLALLNQGPQVCSFLNSFRSICKRREGHAPKHRT